MGLYIYVYKCYLFLYTVHNNYICFEYMFVKVFANECVKGLPQVRFAAVTQRRPALLVKEMFINGMFGKVFGKVCEQTIVFICNPRHHDSTTVRVCIIYINIQKSNYPKITKITKLTKYELCYLYI